MTSDRPPSFRPTKLRLSPVEAVDAGLGRALSNTIHDDEGEPLLVFQLLAHNEALLRRFNSLGPLMRTSTVTSLRQREVIVLRIAHRADCPFEFDQHLQVALTAEMPQETVSHARGQPSGASIGVEDRILLAIADEVFDHDVVSDATWRSASEIWNGGQLIELVMTAGFFRMTAAVINSIGLRPQQQR